MVVPPSLLRGTSNLPTRRSSTTPDDTRFPVVALTAGALGGVALGAATLLLAPVGVAIGLGTMWVWFVHNAL